MRVIEKMKKPANIEFGPELYHHYKIENPPLTDSFSSLWFFLVPFILIAAAFICLFFCPDVFAGPSIPGTDESGKLEAAGTLIRIIDTALFAWGSRIIAGIAVLGGGWAIKEQKIGLAAIAFAGAIVIGTAPMWVKNIFDIGGGTLFSSLQLISGVFGA